MSTTTIRSKLFWTGGSQAVRLPKTMRLPGTEVVIRRQGESVVIAPANDEDAWTGFWDAWQPTGDAGVQRWPTGPAEQRESL